VSNQISSPVAAPGRAETAAGHLRLSAAATLLGSVAVPGRPENVRTVRSFTARVLGGDHPDMDVVVLLVSEMVTNSNAPRGALLYPRCSREELKGGSWA